MVLLVFIKIPQIITLIPIITHYWLWTFLCQNTCTACHPLTSATVQLFWPLEKFGISQERALGLSQFCSQCPFSGIWLLSLDKQLIVLSCWKLFLYHFRSGYGQAEKQFILKGGGFQWSPDSTMHQPHYFGVPQQVFFKAPFYVGKIDRHWINSDNLHISTDQWS